MTLGVDLSASDWASLATAGGTLVLALATFASVRSANRAARTAERALLSGIRPLLFPSRFQDSLQKVTWVDQHITPVAGGHGTLEVTGSVAYMTMSLRNVGSGIAVLHGWFVWPEWEPSTPHPTVEQFRRLTRDLYIAGGDVGFWQGAIRDPGEPLFAQLQAALGERRVFIVDLLYSDHEGGQRTISRFALRPTENAGWLCTVARHWNLDRADPR